MMTTRLRLPRLLACGALLVIAPLSVLAYRIGYGADAPEPVPTHWDLSGEPNATTGLTELTTTAVAVTCLVAVAGLVMLVLVRRHAAWACGVVGASWTGSLVATTYGATLTASAGADRSGDVPLPVGLVVAIVTVPTLVAAVTWLLVPLTARTVAPVPTPGSPLDLRPGERVTWVGQASSTVLLLGALALVLAAVGTVFVLWPVAVALALVSVAVAWAHRITVRIDDETLSVGWGPARWPRLEVPLSEVTAAHVATIEPLAWGGWGYRVTPRGRAAVARRGPGLVLSRQDRSPVAVTVDAPQAAADLVNALVAGDPRRRAVASD